MMGRKLAVLAASVAGAAVLTWTVFEGLRDDGDAPRTADEAAGGSEIGRLVARVAEPERTPSGWEAWSSPGWQAWSSPGREGRSSGWQAWSREAAHLRAIRWLAGGGAADADRRGRSLWDGERDVDRARATAGLRIPRPRASPMGKREPLVSGRSYQPPRRAGQQVFLTSGHRIDPPRVRLPDTASVSLAMRGRSQVPIRVEVCMNEDGRPQGASMIQGTGVGAVDRYVARQMLAGRYVPLWRNGRRVGFCERSTIMLQASEPILVARPPSECGPDC